MLNHQTSGNRRGILLKTLAANSTLPTPGGHKSASHWDVYLSEAVECRGVFRTEAVDAEATAEAVAEAIATEDVHSINHVAPHRCLSSARYGHRSARGQLTPAIGLAKVAEMFWRDK